MKLDVQALSDLVAELRDQSGEVATLDLVLKRVVEMIPDADFVSVTIRRRSKTETLASTDPRADRADAAQYELDEGPCLKAAIEDQWFRSGDVEHDTRWPQWGPVAAREGVGSILAVPLLLDGALAGAINMYCTKIGGFEDGGEIEFAALYAVHVAQVVASDRQVTGLQTALQSRHTIGAAQGILMERYGLTLDESFALLRRYSSTTNTKLNELAATIVETRELPPG